MKCDVCGTHIPLGSKECPQCGYKVRDGVIENESSHISIGGIVKNIILIALVSILVFGGVVLAFKKVHIAPERVTIRQLTFDEMVNRNYHEQYESFNTAFLKREEIRQALFDMDYIDISDESYAYFNANDDLIPVVYLNIFDGDQHYSVHIEYTPGQINQELNIYITTNVSIINQNSVNIELLSIIDNCLDLEKSYLYIDEQRRYMQYADHSDEVRRVSERQPTLVISEMIESNHSYKQEIHLAREIEIS